MMALLQRDFIGRSNLHSHYCRCSQCNRLIKADSYETRQFIRLLGLPFIPLAGFQILDECPSCGYRGKVALKKFRKERKRNLAEMMDGFVTHANDPEICSNALRTLVTYNMKAWFNDVHQSYGDRFDKNPQVQYLIASGLCRFGNYEHAIDHARIAVVLGAGKQAEELLEWCQKLKEVQDAKPDEASPENSTERTWPAYIPIATLAAVLLMILVVQGISAVHTYQAWLVNGSLEPYSFQLDGQDYALEPGSQRHVRLKLGQHELKFDDHQPILFEYSIPFAKQLFGKNLLIINPDALALFIIDQQTDNGPQTIFSQGRQVHNLTGVGYPLFGLKSREEGKNHGVNLYRPPTHLAMIKRLQEMDLANDAVLYARRTLSMNPATDEVGPLLDIALSGLTPEQQITFLRKGLSTIPAVMPWHLRYQDLVMLEQPDHDLAREYTVLCREHPDQPAHYYLLARTLQDPEKAYPFYEHAEKSGSMQGLGFFAIAEDLAARADFEKALPYVEKALNADPDNPSFDLLHEDVLLALEKYEALLDAEAHKTPLSTVRNLTFAGYHMEAEEAIKRFSREQTDLQPRLNAVRYYAVGNVQDYHACLTDAGDPHVELEKLLHADRIASAHRMLTDEKDHPWWEHLVLYYAAMLQQDTDMAAYHLEHAVDDLNRDDYTYRTTAELLAATKAPDIDTLRRLHIRPHEKALLCMALSCRFPHEKETLLELAQQYNYRPEYPQLLLKKWLRAQRKASIRPTS